MRPPTATALRVALAALALLLTGSTAASGDKGIPRTPEFAAKVGRAIDRGVAWIRAHEGRSFQEADYSGFRGGVPALATYTLRACGASRDDPVVQRAMDQLRRTYEDLKKRDELKTYTVALMCMALAEGVDGPATDVRTRSIRLDASDSAWMQEMAQWLESAQHNGVWRYAADSAGYDNSNTQYALLGLRAAAHAGAHVAVATWTSALRHFLQAQQPDGPTVVRSTAPGSDSTGIQIVDRARGWSYMSDPPSFGSMTAGGIASVVICRSQLLARPDHPSIADTRAERAITDGIAWLASHFSVMENPYEGATARGRLYYYLYALERCGVLASVDWMGSHDWYGEGAQFLVDAQRGSGEWRELSTNALPGRVPKDSEEALSSADWDTMTSTCFALLFLKRGTAPADQRAVTPSFDETSIDVEAVGRLPDAEFGGFIDGVLDLWQRRDDDPTARERLLARTTAVGPRIVAPLVMRLSSDRDRVRAAAFAWLVRATGLDHGYDLHAAGPDREASAARWEAWWMTNKDRLSYDAAVGRLVLK